MTHAAKTAPEADEKTVQRLRDAMTFDQHGLELLGPETTRRLAFAVCNKLGLIPRSTEQAEVFLNAMRAAGQLSVADVNSAKWDLLGEEHSAGHAFAPDNEPCSVLLAQKLLKSLSGRKPSLRQQIKAAVEGGPRGRLTASETEAAEQHRAEIEKLRLENTRLKAFEGAFLSILSSLNHLGDYLHGRGELDED